MPVVVRQTRLTPDGLAALGPRWDAFATKIGASFFQRWVWVGTIPFSHPVLIEATKDGHTVGLALANRRGWPTRLHLSETGDRRQDNVFIEHNGPLVDGSRADVLRAMLRVMRPAALSGVSGPVLDAAREIGGLGQLQTRIAPYCDLTTPAPHSRNTRQTLARSARAYGPLTVTRAQDVLSALHCFAALVRAHEATWHARGQPGAFHAPGVLKFHKALIKHGVRAGNVDLLTIHGTNGPVGMLYNFRQGATVHTYQSGFDYVGASGAQRPGLSSHVAAMAWYKTQGVTRYDFLAGDSRYKQSLSTGAVPLHWLQLRASWDPRGWLK